jgi:hypothetical protein
VKLGWVNFSLGKRWRHWRRDLGGEKVTTHVPSAPEGANRYLHGQHQEQAQARRGGHLYGRHAPQALLLMRQRDRQPTAVAVDWAGQFCTVILYSTVLHCIFTNSTVVLSF